MLKLVPLTKEAESNFVAELKQSIGIEDPSKFVALYNQGLLSDKNDTIRNLCELLEKSYINAEYNKRYIMIKSETEAVLISINQMLKLWEFVISLKSLALQLLNEGRPEFERVIFEESQGGFPLLVDPDDNTQFKRHTMGRSMTSDYTNDIAGNPFLEGIIEDYSGDARDRSVVAFEIGAVAKIDDSFILELQKFLQESAKSEE